MQTLFIVSCDLHKYQILKVSFRTMRTSELLYSDLSSENQLGIFFSVLQL